MERRAGGVNPLNLSSSLRLPFAAEADRVCELSGIALTSSIFDAGEGPRAPHFFFLAVDFFAADFLAAGFFFAAAFFFGLAFLVGLPSRCSALLMESRIDFAIAGSPTENGHHVNSHDTHPGRGFARQWRTCA